MKRTERMVGIDGTAHGRMKMSERILIHQRCWIRKPESSSATTIFRLMATTMKMIVLIAERKKIGSSNSLT